MTFDRGSWSEAAATAAATAGPRETSYGVVKRLDVVGSWVRAISDRMISDVPFGVFLSGGIDSSANVALMAELTDAPVQTFSIGFEGQDAYNEFQYARLVADKFGANHHEVRIGMADLLGVLPDLIRFQDEPIADPVCVPVYFVAKLAKAHGVTVCQVGEGADELFCGYPYWGAVLKAERWSQAAASVPPFLKALAPAAMKLFGYGDTRQHEIARRGAAGEGLFWGGAEAFSEAQKRRMLSPDLLQHVGSTSSYDVVMPYRRQFVVALLVGGLFYFRRMERTFADIV